MFNDKSLWEDNVSRWFTVIKHCQALSESRCWQHESIGEAGREQKGKVSSGHRWLPGSE